MQKNGNFQQVELTCAGLYLLLYFSDHKAHLNSLIFSKMEPASYNPVRLMCGSGCALSPSSEQILCCNKPYQRNSTYLNAFYLESNLLFSSLRSSYLLSFPLQVCFSSSPTLVPFTSVSFFSLYVRKHTRASRMYCNMYGS